MSVWDRDDLVAIAAGGIAGIDAIPRGDTASFHYLLLVRGTVTAGLPHFI
jgi:hypothetical protein